MRRTSLTGLLAVMALTFAGGTTPSPLQAQDAGLEIKDEVLTAYARARIDLVPLRIDSQEELAHPTNKSDEAQAEIRAETLEKVSALLESHGLTREEFERITWAISADPAHRDRYKAIAESLSDDPEGT